jgi:APA family basic amino acid/polyamine antiporter
LHSSEHFRPRLGLFDTTAIVVGSMIGSGIFFAPSIMAQWVQAPGILLGLWAFAGLFTLLGAISTAELAAMMPHAGGQYVFLTEAFGRFWGFLYGWTLFLVIQTGFNAAVAIAFAKYLGVFVPALSEANVLFSAPIGEWIAGVWPQAAGPAYSLEINSAQTVACVIIAILTGVNMLGVREGATVQNIFTVLKVAALGGLIVCGLPQIGGHWGNFVPLFDLKPGVLAAQTGFTAGLAVALSKALFAFDGWNTGTFVAEEVRQPQRTLPRALLLGTFVVTLIYVLTNVAYLANLPLNEMAVVPENRVAEPVAVALFGPIGSVLVVIAILVSTFGCLNGLILGGARVCYAMARQRLFFRSCASLRPHSRAPVTALAYQGAWSCVLAISGSYSALLTYTTFASVMFGALTVAGVYRLRATHPDRERPYRCWGYPFTPALYLAIALPFLVYVIVGDPQATLIGLLLMATGIPVYYAWHGRRPTASPDEHGR